MPRDIPVGNGRLLVNFDRKYQIRDFYFPHPGQENQSGGEPFRFGIWADGVFSWISSDEWTRDLDYLEDALVTLVRLRSSQLGLELVSNDAVDFYEDVFIRRLIVRNLTDRPREVRVFFHHDFRIRETSTSITAYYDPSTRAIIHYQRNRYFLIGCQSALKSSFDQWATGTKGFRGAEGTWRDAEDGRLEGNPISQGSVDSTIGITVNIPPRGEDTVLYWVAAGRSHQDVRVINDVVLEKNINRLLHRTAAYWRAWVNKESMCLSELPPDVAESFKRSLLLIRTNIDGNGAILAANDGDVLEYNRDTYSYMWPRDGALTAFALDIAGFSQLTRLFYSFTKDLIAPEGYFLHKYAPDGTPGSSWHPWVNGGGTQLPIQEDETALILWGLWKHYSMYRDIEFIADMYRPVIKLAADFLWRYRSSETGLPLPSWDLWEERRGVHTFTVATVWAGLQAAAHFAHLFNEQDLVTRYATAADEVKQGLISYLYLPDVGRFARGLRARDFYARRNTSELVSVAESAGAPGNFEYDTTIDASLYGVWYFGVLDPEDPMVVSTMESVRKHLWSGTEVGGLARYEGDTYYSVLSDGEKVAGNPWFICTLWLAQYEIARACTSDDLKRALDMIQWVISHALSSGVLAEQVNPYTGEPLSVAPLTWSHAQLVTTVIEYLQKLRELSLCPSCRQPVFNYERGDSGVVSPQLDDYPGERIRDLASEI